MIGICLLLTASTCIGILEYYGAVTKKEKLMAVSLIGICVSGLLTLNLLCRALG